MTTYVLNQPDERGEWYLWADDPTEATAAAIMAGAPWPDAHRPGRALSQYSLTGEQWAAAVEACWDAAMKENGRLDLVGKCG